VRALRVDERYPELLGIGFAPRVLAQQKPAHVRAMRTQGLSDYDVRPPAQNAEYFPIVFFGSISAGAETNFGYDIYSDPVRRTAMERARDAGRVVLTSQLALVQDVGASTPLGFLMYLPVYRGDAAAQTVAQRRDQL